MGDEVSRSTVPKQQEGGEIYGEPSNIFISSVFCMLL